MTMAESDVDTAAQVEGTVDAEVSAPPPVEAPETVETPSPETAQPEAPETVERPRDVIAEMDESVLLEHERLKDIIARREESARRREVERLRREAGSKEQTRANVERIMKEMGIEDADPSRLNFAYDLARANAAYELAQELPTALLGGYELPVDVREAALARKEAQDVDGYIKTLVDGAVQMGIEKERVKIREEERVAADNRLKAELQAKEIEGKPRIDAPPPTASGQPVGTATGEYADFADLARAYNAGEIDSVEYGKQRTKFVRK